MNSLIKSSTFMMQENKKKKNLTQEALKKMKLGDIRMIKDLQKKSEEK